MTNLISSSARTKISSIFSDLHETFGQTITVYKESRKTIVAQTPQYNAIYRNAGSVSTSEVKTVVKRSIVARIKYINGDEEFLEDSNSSIKVPQGSVRIKVKSDDADFIKEAERIRFDGVTYDITSDKLGIGPFAPEYYSFLLTPIDEDAW